MEVYVVFCCLNELELFMCSSVYMFVKEKEMSRYIFGVFLVVL